MSVLRMAYLALAIIGAIWPMAGLWPWLSANGPDPRALVAAWTVDAPNAALFTDIAISATAFTIWVIAETRVRRNWSALWALPATWLIGLSCGLPLYLFLRTRPVR